MIDYVNCKVIKESCCIWNLKPFVDFVIKILFLFYIVFVLLSFITVNFKYCCIIYVIRLSLTLSIVT